MNCDQSSVVCDFLLVVFELGVQKILFLFQLLIRCELMFPGSELTYYNCSNILTFIQEYFLIQPSNEAIHAYLELHYCVASWACAPNFAQTNM